MTTKRGRCLQCGAVQQSTVHQTHHANSEIRLAAHKFANAPMTKDNVMAILKQELNYYERDDRDHYFYLAESEDIERVAERIVSLITETCKGTR